MVECFELFSTVNVSCQTESINQRKLRRVLSLVLPSSESVMPIISQMFRQTSFSWRGMSDYIQQTHHFTVDLRLIKLWNEKTGM